MTDPELIAKKLARIETCVQELRTLSRPELLGEDLREERFVEHTLQIAIQSAIDAAAHVISDERLGEPATLREHFSILARAGWIPTALVQPLHDMAGFRNVLVHGYEEVDLAIVRDVLEHHLDELLAFAAALRVRMHR